MFHRNDSTHVHKSLNCFAFCLPYFCIVFVLFLAHGSWSWFMAHASCAGLEIHGSGNPLVCQRSLHLFGSWEPLGCLSIAHGKNNCQNRLHIKTKVSKHRATIGHKELADIFEISLLFVLVKLWKGYASKLRRTMLPHGGTRKPRFS